jgi:carbonic anhydrase
VRRYHGWKATSYAENKGWYRRLAEDGQRPRAMIISCCDSRVHVTELFGADQGEFFIHRNIANLVPPYDPSGRYAGTSAAVEYAVSVLRVSHLIVIGHSQCGGVQACIDMCKGTAPNLDQPESFVGRWMDILRPRYEAVAALEDDRSQAKALEQQAVLASLENLMTFPFIADAVRQDELTLHGLWTEIAAGSLQGYDAATGQFRPL